MSMRMDVRSLCVWCKCSEIRLLVLSLSKRVCPDIYKSIMSFLEFRVECSDYILTRYYLSTWKTKKTSVYSKVGVCKLCSDYDESVCFGNDFTRIVYGYDDDVIFNKFTLRGFHRYDFETLEDGLFITETGMIMTRFEFENYWTNLWTNDESLE